MGQDAPIQLQASMLPTNLHHIPQTLGVGGGDMLSCWLLSFWWQGSSCSLFWWLWLSMLLLLSWTSCHPIWPHPFWNRLISIRPQLQMGCEVDGQISSVVVEEGCCSIECLAIQVSRPLYLLHHQQPLVEAALGTGVPPMLGAVAEGVQLQGAPLREAGGPTAGAS